MKRHLLAALCVLFLSSAAARAESWVFQPAYYSHDPVTQVRIGRQYSGAQVFTRPTGEYIQSGFRYNRNQINIHGLIYDNTTVFEGWYQVGSKF